MAPPTGRQGSVRSSLSSSDPRTAVEAGRGAAGTRARWPSFSAPAWPPGARSRRGLPRRRSGSAAALFGPGARSRISALRPPRPGSPAALLARTPRCTRTHNARARCPLLSARSGFRAPGAIPGFPLLGRGHRAAARRPSRQRAWGQVRIRRGSPGSAARRGAAPGVWEVAGPRREGGWVCAAAANEGGDPAGTRRGAALLRGGPYRPVPCAPPPAGGAWRVRGPDRVPPSPGLSASSSHDQSTLASAQTFSETPPERFQPKQGPGRRGRRREGAQSQRHPGICSPPALSGSSPACGPPPAP